MGKQDQHATRMQDHMILVNTICSVFHLQLVIITVSPPNTGLGTHQSASLAQRLASRQSGGDLHPVIRRRSEVGIFDVLGSR